MANPLPMGRALAGKYVLADGTGYEIESAEQRSVIVRDYPVIPCSEITLLHDAYWQSPQ